ncbi:3-methyl-2-oxobutanoate dehydrogenase subunit VorB [bacterium]|nr:MAG: 3-methyl-2-oxobutanoate dehydrogenase subunit VorB [bacterium]
MRGNNAMAEAAVRAGCRYYFGYPITPQNDVPEYMAERMPEVGGTFIQGESEIASIYMVLGASAAGGRAMTSSSSPGISLKQEGLSFLAGHELPAVIANVVRGGPGLGNIAGSQSDYFQCTRGGGHGDYRMIVLAPGNVQEMADLTYLSFDLADKYRTPVMIMADGMMGNTMEPVTLPPMIKVEDLPEKDYAVTGRLGKRKSRVRLSLILEPKDLEEHNWKLQRKYSLISANEVRWEGFELEDAEMVIVAFGTAARIAKGAIRRVRKEGLKVGLLRPITLWPFPSAAIAEAAKTAKDFLVFELNAGQMIEDVRLAVEGKASVHFYGRPGGTSPTPRDLAKVITNRYCQHFRPI